MDDFESIYREFQPRIRRYLASLVGEDDAPDLAQAVFLKVSRGLKEFRGESSLAAWIYRIATNAAHDHADSVLALKRGAGVAGDEGGSLDHLADPAAPGTDREYIRREMNACIRGVVGRLPESYREIVLLSELEELSNQEIAEIVGLNVNTVKARLHRGRSALRKAMECQCSFYRDERNELMCDRKS